MIETLVAGQTVELAPGIRRVVAPNPGMMTGPGTNTYLIGRQAVVVIDPGPAIDAHVEQILRDAGAPIGWVLASHTHPDHSPAAAPLAAASGAEIIGLPAPAGPHQDASFRPDRMPADGDVLSTGEFDLVMMRTPGHASNHLCFFIEDGGWLFTGDHVINGSTVVIDPPDGNMSDYLDSLRRLRGLPLSRIAGGHGPVIDAPHDAIDRLIDHRLRREAKVVDRLGRNPGSTAATLVGLVYDEIDPAIYPVAERSLRAHLLKLEGDGAARQDQGRWSLLPG
jgi:glyoxylase-like metal-dependent hydrolase (beta-lactamase superfamily II)